MAVLSTARTVLYPGVLALTLSGCAPTASIAMSEVPPCPAANGAQPAIRWIAPTTGRANYGLNSCDAVGPAIVRNAPSAVRAHAGALLVVSWNVATGGGHIAALLNQLMDEERRASGADPDFILLLQEALRLDPSTDNPDTAGGARNLHSGEQRDDVLAIAERFAMSAVYIPSMMVQGRTSAAREDRGNAILSTLALRNLAAVELPFVRQRRVAALAGVDIGGANLTVLSVHLSTRQPLFRGSIFSAPFARERQVGAVIEALKSIPATEPVIVGGDFNTLAGSDEPAIRLMERHFTRITCGSSITHEAGLALDYVFASDASMIRACDRSSERYGSDHHPLVARLVKRGGHPVPQFIPPLVTRKP